MNVDKIPKYGVVARSQHGHKSPKYWVTMSASIQENYQFLGWLIVNIQKSLSVSYMDNLNGNIIRDTHRIELWSQIPFESDILNVIRRDQVNSVVETWLNNSLIYMEFSIKRKTPSYLVIVTKRIIIPGDWPKPRDSTIFCRYVIRGESEESNRNFKFVADFVFRWWHIRTQGG